MSHLVFNAHVEIFIYLVLSSTSKNSDIFNYSNVNSFFEVALGFSWPFCLVSHLASCITFNMMPSHGIVKGFNAINLVAMEENQDPR
jgi:hypothetical protein